MRCILIGYKEFIGLVAWLLPNETSHIVFIPDQIHSSSIDHMETQKHIEKKGTSYPRKQQFEKEKDPEQGKEASPEFVFSTIAPPNSPQSFKQSSKQDQIEKFTRPELLQMQSISNAEKPNIVKSIVNPIYEEIRDTHKITFKEVSPEFCGNLYTIPVEQRIIYVLQEPVELLYERQKQIAEEMAKQKAEAIAAAEKAAAAAAAKELEAAALEEARRLMAKQPRRPLTFQEKVMIASFIVVAVLLIITMVVLYSYGYLS